MEREKEMERDAGRVIIEAIVSLMRNLLSDEERRKVMYHFCAYCGCVQPPDSQRCQCWNDE